MNARALPGVGEHRYYVAAAIGVIVVVLAGFSIDVPLLSHLGSVSVLVRAHGLIMLTWVALFFAQALLVARHRVDLHMRLGIFGVVLAVAVIVADTATLITACRLGPPHMPPGVPPSLFLAFGLFNLFTFAALVGAAIALRKRRSDWHKRLMLLAMLLLLDAALARFIGAYTTWTVDSSTVRNLFVLACVAVDTFRCRRLHPAFVIGGVLVFANDYLANWAAATPVWLHFSQALSIR
ncbi:MAG TPA: hypothetical protein VN693_00345 [Rhodanobacteraceae bacterium]|nr:hypothetical protein [Rhodanobacteraceae bacterium]